MEDLIVTPSNLKFFLIRNKKTCIRRLRRGRGLGGPLRKREWDERLFQSREVAKFIFWVNHFNLRICTGPRPRLKKNPVHLKIF